jgi:DNA-binding NtrC family response regulator
MREVRNVVESVLVIERGKMIGAQDIRKYMGDSKEIGRNLPVYAHKTSEQTERELIYRALLEMKCDIMEIRNYLSRQPETSQPSAVAVGTSYIDAPIDTENQSSGEHFLPLDEMEKRMIISALERFEGNRRLAARALNISERTLYRKIKEYGLE